MPENVEDAIAYTSQKTKQEEWYMNGWKVCFYQFNRQASVFWLYLMLSPLLFYHEDRGQQILPKYWYLCIKYNTSHAEVLILLLTAVKPWISHTCLDDKKQLHKPSLTFNGQTGQHCPIKWHPFCPKGINIVLYLNWGVLLLQQKPDFERLH